MATIGNRSRYHVEVEDHPELARSFAYTDRAAARAYLESLRAQSMHPVLTQGEEKLLVRIRHRGEKNVTFQTTSYAQAESRDTTSGI
jgi:hypothetical protein